MIGKGLYINKSINPHCLWNQRHTQYRQLMPHWGQLTLEGTNDTQKDPLLQSQDAEYL